MENAARARKRRMKELSAVTEEGREDGRMLISEMIFKSYIFALQENYSALMKMILFVLMPDLLNDLGFSCILPSCR